MNFEFYLKIFNNAAAKLDRTRLQRKALELNVGTVLESVYLKLYKLNWVSDASNPLTAESRIFFSIWLNDQTLNQNKLFYNIHALKLRKLKGYSIASREFAAHFRREFGKKQGNWKNASVDHGPLTLMEGWIEYNESDLETSIVSLAENFIKIESLIDNSLKAFKTSD